MKKLFSLFSLFICSLPVFSQTVLSSCTAPANVLNMYLNDADRLALRRIYQQNLTYVDSVQIPQNRTDTILKALIAVYNATALPARNAVVNTYSIHTFPIPNMDRVIVAADSIHPWMQQLKQGNLNTGNTQINNLISTYSLGIQNYNNFSGIFSFHVVTFRSDSNYNMAQMADLFANIPTVAFTETVGVVGDGNNITAAIFPNYVELTYSIGWEDCPSGCIKHHYWVFRVNYNCAVEFAGESGTPIPSPPNPPTIAVTSTTCVNDTITVNISNANSYVLNNQQMPSSQFTLSAATPTSFVISASYISPFPTPATTASALVSFINCGPIAGLKQNHQLSGFTIYPNPANDHVIMESNQWSSSKEISQIEIYNNQGQQIKRDTHQFSDGHPWRLNTIELLDGIYSIVIRREGSETQNYRLLITK